MNDPNFDHSEGGWEDFPGEPNLSEAQWRDFLNTSERDTTKFLSIYNTLKDKPNHLDEAAAMMGWDVEDISMADVVSTLDPEDETYAEDNDPVPYTLHRHPAFVVTRALYRYLHQNWENFMARNRSQATPGLSWRYAATLHQGEMNVVLAIQALDLGDFGLAICHLKNALAALNQSLALLDQLIHPDLAVIENIRHEARIRIFDLRELWLRMMQDCRSEWQRRPGDED
ncbi:MAG: hypothetical protein ACLFO5_04405 [Opitutales bacterium]